MTEQFNINFGQKGKFGSIDLNKLKNGGMKPTEQIELFKKFNGIDKNNDGKLSQQEMNAFLSGLSEYTEDGKITKQEAKKFLKEQGIDAKAKELFALLEQLGTQFEKDNISRAYESSLQDGTKLVNVEYNPQDGNTVTEQFKDNILYATETKNAGQTVTEYYGEGKKVAKKVIQEGNKTTTIEYDANGEWKSTICKEGSVTKHLNEAGKVIKQETNKGIGGVEIIEYEYGEDGEVSKTTKTNIDGTKEVTEGNKITKYDNNGAVTETKIINEDGSYTITDASGDVKKYDKDGKEITPQKILQEAFKDGKASVTIDGTASGLSSKAYEGEIRLPQGTNLEDGKFPANLKMTLPDSYGENAFMNLKLIDPENGIYSTTMGDRNFQVITGDDGSITMKAVNTETLNSKLQANLDEYERLQNQLAEQEKLNKQNLEEEQALKENKEKLRKEGKEIATVLYEDIDGIGSGDLLEHIEKKVTKDNAADVVFGYEEISPDESLSEAILNEYGLSCKNTEKALNGVFSKLVDKAKEQGIDTAHFEEQYKAILEKSMDEKRWDQRYVLKNHDELDAVFEGLAAAIRGTTISTSQRAAIEAMPFDQKKTFAMDSLETTLNMSQEAFDRQMKHDGWAGDFADWISQVWQSENRAVYVREDLDKFKKQIDELKSAQSEDDFKSKFKEIFGVDFNPVLIKAFESKQQEYIQVKAIYEYEQYFNERYSTLVSKKPLKDDGYRVGHEFVVTLSAEDMYNRELNTFAECLGNGDIDVGMEIINNKFAAELEPNANIFEKYDVLCQMAQEYSQQLNQNTLKATDGKGFAAYEKEYNAAYNAAYGTTNDIARRVQDYNVSQQTGAMIVKSATTAIGTTALAFIPGGGLILTAVGTSVISAGVNLTDRISSEVGLQEGEIEEILRNAGLDGLSVLAGGVTTKMLSTARGFVQAGGNIISDVAVGAAVEQIQTGTITIDGVIFQAVFSGAGNLVPLKQLKNADAVPTSPKPDVDISRTSMDEVLSVNQSHLSAGPRRQVQEAFDDIPTNADIAAYQRSLSEAPTPQQKTDIDLNNAQAAEASARAHQLGENIPDDVRAKLLSQDATPAVSSAPIDPNIAKLEQDLRGIDGSIRALEQKITGAKKYNRSTTSYEAQLETLRQKRAVKAAELEAVQGSHDVSKNQTTGSSSEATASASVKPDAASNGGFTRDNVSSMDLKSLTKELEDQGIHVTKQSFADGQQNIIFTKDNIEYSLVFDDKGKCLWSRTAGDGKAIEKSFENGTTFEKVSTYSVQGNAQTDLSLTEYKADGTKRVRDYQNNKLIEYDKNGKVLSETELHTKVKQEPRPDYSQSTPEQDAGLRRQKERVIQDLENRIALLKQQNPNNSEISRLEDLLEIQKSNYKKTYGVDYSPNSPSRRLDLPEAKAGTKLKNGDQVVVNADAQLLLGGQYSLDLSSPEIRNRLNSLQEGETITVGRLGDIRVPEGYLQVSKKHLEITKQDGKIVVKDVSSNGTKVEKSLPELNENELVRYTGNNGKSINADYIRTSREARQYLLDAIESGKYTESLESYIETMNNMHIVSAKGKNGTSDWYSQVGEGSINVNPGVIRGEGTPLNSRTTEAGWIESIAKKYGDPYRADQSSKVKLEGIPDDYLPQDVAYGVIYQHIYPNGKSLKNYYYKEMHRTSKEALDLIKNGASKNEILAKLAEHYQYAANARPYGQINNSLFMNEINTMLTKAGMKTIPHGILDHAAQRLQPDTFKRYFIDQYYATALN